MAKFRVIYPFARGVSVHMPGEIVDLDPGEARGEHIAGRVERVKEEIKNSKLGIQKPQAAPPTPARAPSGAGPDPADRITDPPVDDDAGDENKPKTTAKRAAKGRRKE